VIDPIFEAMAEAARAGTPVVLGIISGVKGSSPQKLGARAVFYPDGRIKGTLGGGCLEAEVQKRAIQSLRTGRATTFDLLLDHDFGWDDGLICGGKVQGLILPNAQTAGEEFWNSLAQRKGTIHWGVTSDFSIGLTGVLPGRQGASASDSTGGSQLMGPASEGERTAPGTENWLYLETVQPPASLWIAGAGHIAQAVAPLALQLDFDVTVLDDRPALANHRFFPKQVSLQADVWNKLLSLPLPATAAFGLIVTRGHRHDALVLQSWILKPFLFVGMIGSSRKARTIFEHFAAENIATPRQLERVACPVGIKIRSRTVMEIAVSIMAQFIDKRSELLGGNQPTMAPISAGAPQESGALLKS
jgi:xanthine dehydrogenase accessory factor